MAVIFGEDALSQQSIERLFTYIEKVKKSFTWASNVYLWQPTLTVTSGIVLAHQLSEEAARAIYAELAFRDKLSYLPKKGSVLFYSWQAGSNITWHKDYNDLSSMTIYLSKDWNPNHGGYFCWKEWGDSFPRTTHSESPPEECMMRLPKFNHYVHMTEGEWHTTTITASSAPPRLSLQLFFSKD